VSDTWNLAITVSKVEFRLLHLNHRAELRACKTHSVPIWVDPCTHIPSANVHKTYLTLKSANH